MERVEVNRPKLRHEYKVYRALRACEGTPRALEFGTEYGYNAIVMNRYGPSLEELFHLCGTKFTLKTVLLIADQLVSSSAVSYLCTINGAQITQIEYLHNSDYVHRDLKPDNLLIGISKDQPRVHVIDFGLANQYRDPVSKRHIPLAHKRTITGTARYLSIHNHLGIEHSRRDDLESLGYIFIYFLRGSLPWQDLEASSRKEKYRHILKRKLNVSIESLCMGLPESFDTFLNYARDLPFDARPDYTYLRTLFQNTFYHAGFHNDNEFDWSLKSLPSDSSMCRDSNQFLYCRSEHTSSSG